MSAQPLTAFFKDIDKEDIPLVGGKGANLGEMTQAGFPVPNGFAVTVPAYDLFLEKNIFHKKIRDILKQTNVHNPEELNEASKRIQKIIIRGEFPKEVSDEIISS